MFKERLMSSVILVIITLATIMMGGPVLAIVLSITSMIGMKEIYKIQSFEKSVLGFIGYLGAVLYYIMIFVEHTEYNMIVILGVLVALLAIYVLSFPKFNSLQVMFGFFGFVYVAILLSYIYQIRIMEQGIYIVWLAFISSWVCDTCAYCVGVLFGKHKMAPILSPKKSIEGAVGGLVGAFIAGGIYGYCISRFGEIEVEPLAFAIICFVGGMISMIGDLAASGIKRDNGVKDYGTIIPGHGGILDRFDSLIFTAPVIYYLAIYIL